MNKKMFAFVFTLALGAWYLVPCSYAEPQRLAIKDPDRKTKEEVAKSQIRRIDLQGIEDPEARKAIKEILNYLDLKSK